MQWSDSISIAEAVTKARPGRTSPRADEWRIPPVRFDPKFPAHGTNDPYDGKPLSHSLSALHDLTGTVARREGSCERRGYRTRMSMRMRMRHGWEGERGTDLPAASQE